MKGAIPCPYASLLEIYLIHISKMDSAKLVPQSCDWTWTDELMHFYTVLVRVCFHGSPQTQDLIATLPLRCACKRRHSWTYKCARKKKVLKKPKSPTPCTARVLSTLPPNHARNSIARFIENTDLQVDSVCTTFWLVKNGLLVLPYFKHNDI